MCLMCPHVSTQLEVFCPRVCSQQKLEMRRRSETERSESRLSVLPSPTHITSMSKLAWLFLILLHFDSPNGVFFFFKIIINLSSGKAEAHTSSRFAIAAALCLWLIQLRECNPACFPKLFAVMQGFLIIILKEEFTTQTMCFAFFAMSLQGGL